ncbi:MAG: alpha/beta fold hydrolase [Chloroflexi bacterium]|nr:alpha/beta fold hydrolase [Chloroflexota bacterium]MBT3864247.1 alpha/beta fold hydrolase [Chloroflexota bacterium]MBT4141660.1 alpha/beta fold hydrolase [Chloroflexota bacterium]MBT4942511.1 alpha/beta fold hydrolase [Chloroflexota bacterium]MBT5253602.1 alpha/beta fold hydrolase [Chloroflexota bacterium]
MLMHGTTGNSKASSRLGIVDDLKDEYQLILVDARGDGKSDKPHDPAAYLTEPKANDIKAVLDHLTSNRRTRWTTRWMGESHLMWQSKPQIFFVQ